MDPIILVQRQFESTINTMHLSNDLSNSVTRCLDEAATLMARNDWAKTSSLLDTSARYSSDSIRMLENAHSDLTRLSSEVLPLEAMDNVTFSDILKGLDRMIAQLRETESKISHTISRVDEARSRFPRMAFINTMPSEILSDVFELLILSGFSFFSTEDIDREDSTATGTGSLPTLQSFGHTST
ncbi:hypothetical protein FRC12_019206 [Ceratobasidium sp. 428]|nr:hypothetical protein FRC12_019206 [Ceratobasidium sp. 428]